MRITLTILIISLFVSVEAVMRAAEQAAVPTISHSLQTAPRSEAEYAVGTGDQLKVWALGLEDLYDRPVAVDPEGSITLPLAGRIPVAGMTIQQIRDAIVSRLKSELKNPEITVTIVEYKSHPVSVLGAVNTPGVHYLQGHKTLSEVLAMAGGLRQDAGNTIKITRTIAAAGHLPLPSAKDDGSGHFSIGDVQLKDFLEANAPGQNIAIRTNDVITVPRAQLVYVLGEVTKAGGFVLNEREEMSSVQALSLAGGMTVTAAPKKARILRNDGSGANRKEIPVNIAKILSGEAPDIALQPEDVLFVPDSKAKKLTAKLLETSLNLVTGVVIWRR